MSKVEVDEVLRLCREWSVDDVACLTTSKLTVGNEASKVSSDDAVPRRPFPLVELGVVSKVDAVGQHCRGTYGLLDVMCDILHPGQYVQGYTEYWDCRLSQHCAFPLLLGLK